MAAKIYTDKDANIEAVKSRKLAIIGFGSQGHAHALNLKDSGCDVTIGLHAGSKSRTVAKDLGFEVMDVAEAVQAADVIMVAAPDTVTPGLYKAEIEPHLSAGKTLFFAHGFAVHYGFITPPAEVNVALVAPKGPGHTVRSQFTQNKGVPGLVAVHQDATGDTLEIALGWAKGLGCTRGGVFETTFREETNTDLFGEQAVLCGGASALVKAGFETLVEAGYQPEMAYFECLHELKLIVDLMVESGIAGMRFSVSETAEWGDVSVGPKIIDASVKERMKAQLKEIEEGTFAREWMAEYEEGCTKFNALRKEGEEHEIEVVGGRLRDMMSWLGGHKKIEAGMSQASYISESK